MILADDSSQIVRPAALSIDGLNQPVFRKSD